MWAQEQQSKINWCAIRTEKEQAIVKGRVLAQGNKQGSSEQKKESGSSRKAIL
jgi:hypothetical protein